MAVLGKGRNRTTASPNIGGRVAAGFEPVRDAFVENFAERGELGGAVCVVVDGAVVVDLWGPATGLRLRHRQDGHAPPGRPSGPRPATSARHRSLPRVTRCYQLMNGPPLPSRHQASRLPSSCGRRVTASVAPIERLGVGEDSTADLGDRGRDLGRDAIFGTSSDLAFADHRAPVENRNL
jgi:hypothetical protein